MKSELKIPTEDLVGLDTTARRAIRACARSSAAYRYGNMDIEDVPVYKKKNAACSINLALGPRGMGYPREFAREWLSDDGLRKLSAWNM
jgi:hypothetical protein